MSEKNYAIHTVFIAKENILFLEQWIDYHMLLGFNKFYLYDNSKVNLTNDPHNNTYHEKNVIPNKINKYCINYDEIVKLSDTEIVNILKKIEEKYSKNIRIIEWSPRNKENKVMYEQRKAHNNCLIHLKKDNIDWCAFIDMDEYIVINNKKNINLYLADLENTNISCIKMKCHNMLTRFSNIKEPCINILKGIEKPRNAAQKNIIKIKDCKHVDIHWCILENNKQIKETDDILFLHYNCNKDDEKYPPIYDIDIINIDIKNQINYNFHNAYIKIL